MIFKKTSSLLLLLLLLLSFIGISIGCGMVTHNTIGRKALRFWMENHPGFEQVLNRNLDAFQPGTPAPDWGYAAGNECGWCPNAAEDFHWPPFYRVASDYIRSTYGTNMSNWSVETEKFVTFIYGAWAHSTGDLTWHALNGQREGLINIMSEQETSSWSDAHGNADTGGEFLVSNEFNNDFILPSWYLPTDDMLELYNIYGYPDVTEELFVRYNRLLFIGAQAVKLGGWILYPYIALKSNFLPERYLDYFAGGVDDLGIWTSICYNDLTEWIVSGDTTDLCMIQAIAYANKINNSSNNNKEDPLFTRRRSDSIEFIRMAELVDQMNLLKVETIKTSKGVIFRLDENSHNYTSKNFRLPVEVFRNSFEPNEYKKLEELFESQKLVEKTDEEEDLEIRASCINPIQAEYSVALSADTEEAYLGTSVLVGDVNNDGIDDLIMGAPGWGEKGDPQVGAVYILFGDSSLDFSGHPNLDLIAEADVVLIGERSFSRFGTSLAIVDLNSDGLNDLAVSAPTFAGQELLYSGMVYVYYGAGTSQPPSDTPSLFIFGDENSNNLGSKLVSGDVDNDGYDDLIIGSMFASREWSNSIDQVGRVQIHLSFSPRPELPTYVLYGENGYGSFGQSIAFEYPYLFVGSPSFKPSQSFATKGFGKVYGYDVSKFINGTTPETPILFTVTGNEFLSGFGSDVAIGSPYPDGSLCVAFGAANEDDYDNIPAFSNYNVGVVRISRISDILNSPNFPTFTSPTALPVISTFYGDRQFQRLGHRMFFIKNQNREDDLVLSEMFRYRNSGNLYTLRGGSSFPTGTSRGLIPFYSELCYIGPSDFGRFGNDVSYGDLNNDGWVDQIVASYRSYDDRRSPVGGMVYILPHLQ